MADKKQIESILRVNGLGTSAPDEEIRSVLMSARFNDDEVNTALVVLRENTKTCETRVDGLHKVFRTDEGLKPKEVSRLLGIDITIKDLVTKDSKKRDLSFYTQFLLVVISLLLATILVVIYMYINSMGVFHPTSVLKINIASLQ